MKGYGEFLVVGGGWLDDGWIWLDGSFFLFWMFFFFCLDFSFCRLVGCGVPLCLKWICCYVEMEIQLGCAKLYDVIRGEF